MPVKLFTRYLPAALLLTTTMLASSKVQAQVAPPEAPSAAHALENSNALPITPFYSSLPTTPGTPGQLIRMEKAADYPLPAGITAYRILYHSLDATRKPVISSAFVLIPSGQKPEKGWPIVAWAHGTSGVAQMCAPSRMKDLYYGEEGLFEFPKAGLAVVASDYHGLGTPGRHQYLNKIAQAYDVIYSVAAAQTALPQLGKDWVADGHSQGGLVSWGVGEMEYQIKNPHYLGTISVSGSINTENFVSVIKNEPKAAFYAPLFVAGMKARFPDLDVSTLLTEKGTATFDEVSQKGCWFTAYAVNHDKSIADLVRPNFFKNHYVQQYLAESYVGQHPVQGPIYVITGSGDQSISADSVKEVAQKACHAHLPVSFRLYPGLDHDPTMITSTPDQITWIKERLDGKPFTSNCGTF